jgi:cytochrome bd ubiquinol oxidase subunit II
MPPSEIVLGGVLVLALVLYFLLGGADFGGGVWDLLARGPRREAQRGAIARALGPVWEPNHVWLIFAIVVLFTAFPRAFAALATGLYVPLTLFLVGIVLRGSAFSFRAVAENHHHHGDGDGDGDAPPPATAATGSGPRRWGTVFSIASVVSPFLLGAMVAAVASGRVVTGDPSEWLTPFAAASGALALILAAFLAATYLTVEVSEPELREDFRRRALGAGVAAGAIAGVGLLLAEEGAPLVYLGLTERPYTWPLHAATAVAALGALGALWRRRFRLARALAAAQVALVILGWAVSQYPYLVPPALTLADAAAPVRTRTLLLVVLAVGTPLLVPSLVLLYRVFKRSRVVVK